MATRKARKSARKKPTRKRSSARKRSQQPAGSVPTAGNEAETMVNPQPLPEGIGRQQSDGSRTHGTG